MPPAAKNNNKKKKAAAAATGGANKKAKTTTTKKSPYDLYFEERNKWLNEEENKHIIGAIMTKGIQSSGDSSDDDDDSSDREQDKSKYTKAQMEGLRFIMITENRDKQLKQMRELVLGDQAKSQFMMFSTSFSYQVMDSWNVDMKKRLSKLSKKPADKLDLLIGYTHTLMEYDVWMDDNEGGMEVVTNGLANSWKTLLAKNTDDDLGWDTKYTKPGVLEMLKQFKTKVNDSYELGKFKYE